MYVYKDFSWIALRLCSAWAGENAAVDGNWTRDNEAESAGAHPFSFVPASQTELGVDIFIFGVWLLGICDGKSVLATNFLSKSCVINRSGLEDLGKR